MLEPGPSEVAPTQVNTQTRFTREIALNIPLVSAAMDTVTESRLAVAMAQAGGLGILHRNLSPAEQADQVREVKRFESGMVVDPITIAPDATLAERFRTTFVAPGHVYLLYAAPGLVDERKGHTELAISLARMAGLSESATVCEMLGDSGGARAPEAAQRYAEDHGFEFLDGRTILEAWRTWSSA